MHIFFQTYIFCISWKVHSSTKYLKKLIESNLQNWKSNVVLFCNDKKPLVIQNEIFFIHSQLRFV